MDNNKKYFAVFIIQHLYYIPQFLPVVEQLKKNNLSLLFYLSGKDSPEQNLITEQICKDNDIEYSFFSDSEKEKPNCRFMINGANSFPEKLVNFDYSASIVHGIGTKAGYYTAEQNKHDIRFIEGQARVDRLKEKFPDSKCKLFNVGFAKLDTVINYTNKDIENIKKDLNLDVNKKTILYAPTFYPSSIENMPKNFPKDFSEYNIIIKPHFFSYLKRRYKHQVKKFKQWGSFPNVYMAAVEDYNLTPFMAIADIMISDESSAIFEFAALNKPVIVNKNVYYRFTYRVFKSKIRKRMDSFMGQYKTVGKYIFDYSELKNSVEQELCDSTIDAKERYKVCEQIVGSVDGKVSERIVDILKDFK